MWDYQRSKLYSWERKYVAPHDHSKVDLKVAKTIVDYIWQSEGLKYPPKVLAIAEQSKKSGQANRSFVWLQSSIPTWIVIHEVAHSMNSTNDGDTVGDHHGPDYVGIYMKLLTKYLNLSLPVLMFTARKDNLDFNLAAQPLFLD